MSIDILLRLIITWIVPAAITLCIARIKNRMALGAIVAIVFGALGFVIGLGFGWIGMLVICCFKKCQTRL